MPLRLLAVVLLAASVAPFVTASDDDGRMRVTAVVTNPRGEPVRGLRPRDFELKADGVAQEVESAQLASAPAETPRVFALMLDEFHVEQASSSRVREALTRFVESELRPADLVLLLKPLDSLTAIEPIRDRARLHDLISSFEGRKGDYTPRTAFEQKYMPHAPDAVAPARAQIVTAALRALAARLADMEDVRAAIVFISDGFGRTRGSRERPADLHTVIRPAAGAALPVYALSVAPVAALPDGEGDRGIMAVRALAAQTGGEFSAGADAMAAALARVSRDLDLHYVLTYRPSHGEDGRFHSLQLAVKRRDAQIRARSGYVAPMSPQMRAARAAALGPKPAARMLRRSPLIHAWTGFSRGSEGTARVMLTWEPKRLGTPVRRPPPMSVVVTASAADGEVIFQGTIAPVGAGRGADIRDAAQFEAVPGRLMIDINVLDASGAVMDVDARDVDVPDLRKPGILMLPASVLRARSAREFRAVSADPDAPPVPSREFRRTDRLLIRVPAYDGGAAAMVTATLLNGWRQPMRTLLPMTDVPRVGITQFDVPLAALAPGEYVIQVSAADSAQHVVFRVTS